MKVSEGPYKSGDSIHIRISAVGNPNDINGVDLEIKWTNTNQGEVELYKQNWTGPSAEISDSLWWTIPYTYQNDSLKAGSQILLYLYGVDIELYDGVDERLLVLE
jgi:hypothetical protein